MRSSSSMGRGAVAAALILTAVGRPAASATLRIAAASDLQFAMEEVKRQFSAVHPGVELSVAYGSSGNFYAQMQNGAPFDVFLSADVEYPRKLAQEGTAVADTLFTYGVGRIVVWAPAKSAIDPAVLHMAALEAASVRHIAIANPQHAPYGRAAEAALRGMGLYDKVASRLVLGENITQTLEFVQSGAAEVGIVALSLAMAPQVREQGRYWEIPLSSCPRLEQGGVLLMRAKDSEAARAFRGFLTGSAGREILKQYGFSVPEP